jgi:flagellar biosynthesis protein FlhG
MYILPIASGKGGVGKSLVSTNLSIALAQAGKRVVLVDLDLGASNLHLMLGISSLGQGLGTYLTNGGGDFSKLILPTPYDNLRFIPGDAEIPGMANVTVSQKTHLIKQLMAIEDTDFLILDLGAGSGANTVDFFLTSGQGIVVTAPTLSSTLNAYLFLKNVAFRLILNSFGSQSAAFPYIERLLKDGKALQQLYLPKLLAELERRDAAGYRSFEDKMDKFRPALLMNMLEDPKDAQKAGKIRRSCREYLAIDMEHYGIVYYDHLQDIALNSRMPILIYKPQSVLSQAIYRLADKVIQRQKDEFGLFDFDSMDDSYLEAELEAEVDFDAKIHEMENLLHSGALTRGDLIDTIRSQQYEINALKKQNNVLKGKIAEAADAGYLG